MRAGLGTIEKKAVTAVGAPSNIIPSSHPRQDDKDVVTSWSDVSDSALARSMLCNETAVSTASADAGNGVARELNIFDNSENSTAPVKPYTREQPKRRSPDEKTPRRKYFTPASVENSESRLKAARI
ncbi:MAG: hypothetical protein M1812_007548 [Candelaria pacifica]|nr:MAG: hypothetical protein M1812_007548 [Candelaria pacifica]